MARWNCTGEAAICDSMKIEHTSGLPTFVSVSPIRGSSKCHMGLAIAHAAAVLSVYSIVIGKSFGGFTNGGSRGELHRAKSLRTD